MQDCGPFSTGLSDKRNNKPSARLFSRTQQHSLFYNGQFLQDSHNVPTPTPNGMTKDKPMGKIFSWPLALPSYHLWYVGLQKLPIETRVFDRKKQWVSSWCQWSGLVRNCWVFPISQGPSLVIPDIRSNFAFWQFTLLKIPIYLKRFRDKLPWQLTGGLLRAMYKWQWLVAMETDCRILCTDQVQQSACSFTAVCRSCDPL